MKQKTAFTLIEMLVTISVMSLLMAIMMPALSKARQQCDKVLCSNNLRQMAVSSQLYTNDNDGFYPIAYFGEFVDSVRTLYAWDFTTIDDFNTGERKVIPGLLWDGETIEQIQQCPSFQGYHWWLADPFTGYNYNTSFIGHGQSESCVTPARATEVRKPQSCALFGDGQWAKGANKFMRSPLTSECDNFFYRTAGTQGYRHLGRTNVAYCDGSVKSVEECYKGTDPTDVADGTGFLSEDNSAYDLE